MSNYAPLSPRQNWQTTKKKKNYISNGVVLKLNWHNSSYVRHKLLLYKRIGCCWHCRRFGSELALYYVRRNDIIHKGNKTVTLWWKYWSFTWQNDYARCILYNTKYGSPLIHSGAAQSIFILVFVTWQFIERTNVSWGE